MNTETTLLYYQDAYLKESTAKILEIKADKEGAWILTDQTVFYPGGGGQPADSGTIDGKKVLSVRKKDQQVWHLLDRFQKKEEASVQMKIDWERRLFMMQQHSGQHLISNVAMDYKMNTVSVHFGEEHTLIEFEPPLASETILTEIEDKVNALIRAHIPMHIHWVNREAALKFPLRRPAGDWRLLRILEIEGRDYSACGGTHLKNTAEIGLVKITGTEKIRGHLRIRFLMGLKAYRYFSVLHQNALVLRRELQAEPQQFSERAAALQNELSRQKKQKAFYRNRFLTAESKRLARDNTSTFVFKRLAEDLAEDAADLAKTIVNNFVKPAFIIGGERFYFIVPKESVINAAEFLEQFGTDFSMRGGGPPDFVQGLLKTNDDIKLQKAIHRFISNTSRGAL